MDEVKYFLRLADRCAALASECSDNRTASQLTKMSDEFLNRAARISSLMSDVESLPRVPDREAA